MNLSTAQVRLRNLWLVDSSLLIFFHLSNLMVNVYFWSRHIPEQTVSKMLFVWFSIIVILSTSSAVSQYCNL